jgi:hypothetical protein
MISVRTRIAFGLAAILGAVQLQAQVGALTPEESVRGPPRTAPSARQPSKDPRDFEGSYRAAQFLNPGGGNARGGGGRGPGAGGAGNPGSAGTGGGGGPPAGYVPPTGPYTSANCVPSFGGWGGGPDGPSRVMQSDSELIMVSEEMHNIRRIYINQEHPQDFKGSYSGDSVAHWEGDVLVVDTIGIRAVGAPADGPLSRRSERIRKLEDGSLENTAVTTNAQGVASAPRTSVLNFTGDQRVLEWICEDLGGVYFNGNIKL